MTRVKICGISRVEHALAAADTGADFLGFVFAPSRRQIAPEAAAEIIAAVREVSAIKIVGLFVNAPVEEMNRVARLCRLDYVQLSGNEPDDIIGQLEAPAIQVIHVGGDLSPERLAERVSSTPAELVLLDTARAGTYGGTGESFDWSLIPPIDRPWMLAGGLHAESVAQAVRQVRPWAVDVSSGVESGGVKDPERIRAFVEAVRMAAQSDLLRK